MGNEFFNRNEEEKKIQNLSLIDKKKKNKLKLKWIFSGLLIAGACIGVFFTFGLVLLVDGGITLTYIIVNISLKSYNEIVEKYMEHIPSKKKRDFLNSIHKFYEKIFIDSRMTDNANNNVLKDFINQFIEEENILQKTSDKITEKRNKIIDESNKLKEKFNILIIGPTGAGKSTLINEFLQINEAKEKYLEPETYDFHSYTTPNSEYTLIDSQGLDYSKSINEFLNTFRNYIIDANKNPNTFIDMIYYCTDSRTRLQPEEINLIEELKKIYDLERVPLIIVHTLSTSNEFHNRFKQFIRKKYGENYTVIDLLARKLDNNEAHGLDDLKEETRRKKENIFENAYYSKFIANISKNIYNEYIDNVMITKIKGYIYNSKKKSTDYILNSIFNMYRFKKSSSSFNDNQKYRLEEFRNDLIANYKNNIDEFINIVIRYNAESDVYYELKEKKLKLNEKEQEARIDELYEEKHGNEFDVFKKDIDTLLFPCLNDIFKTKIVSYFNQKIMSYLQPTIENLMVHN